MTRAESLAATARCAKLAVMDADDTPLLVSRAAAKALALNDLPRALEMLDRAMGVIAFLESSGAMSDMDGVPAYEDFTVRARRLLREWGAA